MDTAGFAGNIYRPCAAIATGFLPHAALADPCAAIATGILPHATLAHPCAAEMPVLQGVFIDLSHRNGE